MEQEHEHLNTELVIASLFMTILNHCTNETVIKTVKAYEKSTSTRTKMPLHVHMISVHDPLT